MTIETTQPMLRMLVVDDELGICDFLRVFFSRQGYDVRIATSGDEALRVAQEFSPRVVLLDIRLHGLSGLDVLESLRANDSRCTVIMMTAVLEDGIMEQARRLGAADYITKPFSLDYLERVVLKKLAGL